jgi:hypothetical protein
LDEFLNRVEHFIDADARSGLVRPFAIYHSLDFSCTAAKSGSEWILIAGRAALGTERCASESLISPVVKTDNLVALSGRLGAADVEALVNNLKGSLVVAGVPRYKVRLMPVGAGECIWQGPVVRPVDKSLYPSSRWTSELWMHGTGANVSSLVAPWWQQIDDQLLHGTPRFKDFNGLCRKLHIPARRDYVSQSSFHISAELPAQFISIDDDRKKKTLEVSFECVGTPLLMVEWLPGGDLDSVQWDRDPGVNRQRASIEVRPGSPEVELTLLFDGLGRADSLRYRVPRESILPRIAEYFDPQQTRLQEYLSEKTSADANPFELGVARLLSTGGFVVQWFGKASRDALPDIVAYWRSPRGEEHVILAECTMRDPTGKLTDLAHRRRLMSEGTGIAANRILPVLFLRTSATTPDFKAAAERGIALCDAERLRELRDRIMSGETPPEICAALHAWALPFRLRSSATSI